MKSGVLDVHTRLRASKDVVWKEVMGEAVLLTLEGGQYYGLNDMGTRVWKGLLEGTSMIRVVRLLADEFDVTARQAESDVLALAQRLLAAGLVEVEDGE